MKYALLVFFCSLVFCSRAMDKDTTGNFFLGFSKKVISLSKESNPRNSLFPGYFEVVDVRPDTARIGLYTDWFLNIKRQTLFPEPVSKAISYYLNRFSSKNAGNDTFRVVIKKLWISDLVIGHEEEIEDPEQYLRKSQMRLKAEIYLKSNDRYFALIRFDTLAQFTKNAFFDESNEMAKVLDSMMASISHIDINWKRSSKKALYWSEIDEYNRSVFEYNIFKDSIFNPGVYQKFDEFRNNAPSSIGYELVKKNKGFLLYLRDKKGLTYYTRDVWGICQGKDIYVMVEGMLYKASKEGNALYLLGSKQIEMKGSYPKRYPGDHDFSGSNPLYPAPGLLGNKTNTVPMFVAKPTKKMRPFCVDMESGEVY
ncbi:MAG TPA: hypothetical protein VK543_12765 [Puia sp.]|nr:hypothetical protein [Puia sp.]